MSRTSPGSRPGGTASGGMGVRGGSPRASSTTAGPVKRVSGSSSSRGSESSMWNGASTCVPVCDPMCSRRTFTPASATVRAGTASTSGSPGYTGMPVVIGTDRSSSSTPMSSIIPAAAPPDSVCGVLPHVNAIRYVTPLREGGSLPGVVEADDLGTYVMKFHGAGQGRKALIAEVIAGELARRLGLRVPDQVLIDLDPAIGRHEPDPDVQDLLKASPGWNL